jgi:hypothetical protein
LLAKHVIKIDFNFKNPEENDMTGFNSKRAFLYLLMASVALSAVIGIVVLIFGNFGEFETKVLLTTLTVTVTSILGLACGAYLETGRGRVIPIAGIVVAVVSCVMWVYLVWHGTVNEDFYAQFLLSLTLFSAMCAHISLLSLATLDKRFIWSRYAFILTDSVMTAYLLFLIWNDKWIDSDITPRIIGVLSIVVAALTLVTPVFHKLSTGTTRSAADIDSEIEELKARIADLETQRAELS